MAPDASEAHRHRCVELYGRCTEYWTVVMTPRYRFALSDNAGLSWHLVRNCAMTPRQLGALYGSLCMVSVLIGTGFWLRGALLVAPFAVLEMFVVGVAFLIYARHATDGERVRLAQGQLEVKIELAGKVTRTVLQRQLVRVQPPVTPSALIELSGQGQSVWLGRHVRPELRAVLARELDSAVRHS
jgi:uncharacterized membrane protein